MKTLRLTKQSSASVRNAQSYSLNEINGLYWVMVYGTDGTPCQLHSGDGPMLYTSQLAALRALTRLNPHLEARK